MSTILKSLALIHAVLTVALGVHGFTPAARPTTTTTTVFSTLEKMSTDDHDVLFGGEPSSLNIPNSKANIPRQADLQMGSLDFTTDPLINDLRRMRDSLTNCPQLWSELANICPDKRALLDEHMCDEKVDVNFKEMNDLVKKSASVFLTLGISKGDNVAVFGENSAKWLMVDHGIQMAGGASAVRGADAPGDELRYIYEHSDSAGIAVLQGPKLMKRLAKEAAAGGLEGLGLSNPSSGNVKTIILMHREKTSDEELKKLAQEFGVQVQVFSDLLNTIKPATKLPKISPSDLATIVYTSGTTGSPKGVMLEHGNLLHQIGHRLAPTQPYMETEPLPGNTMVSLLPVWHITERTFELWMASRGCSVVYSSIRSFKNDLPKHNPEWMVLVPRVLEKIATGVQNKFANGSAAVKALSKLFTTTSGLRAKHTKIAKGLVVGSTKPSMIERFKSKATLAALTPLNTVGDALVWKKVKEGFGGNVKTIICGGSALAGGLETFYETAGIPIIVGYGLTECSPLLSHRRCDANLVTPGCVGWPTYETEVRVVPQESSVKDGERPSIPNGNPGVILGRGPQVMRGYYKNPEATAEAVDRFGWFDTGDLGYINQVTGDLIITGRAKDTIVLSNGENIEPSPIEDAILSESDLIEQVMLTGQDGRRLLGIAVLSPNELVTAGFLTQQEGAALQKENEKVNDPKCSVEDCQAASMVLNTASERLRNNVDLKKALLAQSKVATKTFRPWEQVSEVYVTLEPFAMANGQLTQSYKVKRASVMDRYGADIGGA